jgi:hypothetical protein
MVNAGIVMFITHASIACSSTNETSMSSCLSQLALADKSEATAYYSDRDKEITKFLRVTNRVSGTNEKAIGDKTSVTLSAIPTPRISDTTKDALKSTTGSGKKFLEEGILPVWTGSEWVDGMTLVVNGFPVPKEIRTRLLNINFQERAFGAYFWPESERKKRSQFSGFHPTDRFLLSRITLENMGYKLEFDKTFYIWRITGTNAPATHSH